MREKNRFYVLFLREEKNYPPKGGEISIFP